MTSLSGYNIDSFGDQTDNTTAYSARANQLHGVSGGSIKNDLQTRKLTQELRLSAPLGEKMDLLLGAFYTDEKTSHWRQDVVAVNANTGAIAGDLITQSIPFSFQEYAGFADLTYHFTDRFDVQIGGRESRARGTYEKTTRTLTVAGFATARIPEIRTRESSFTYLLTPRFKVTPDLMTYVRVASGYRPGAPNSNAVCGAVGGAPCAYGPDKTVNYEVGLKGAALDRTLSFDASVYYIDWKDIQLTVFRTLLGAPVGFFENAGRARSQGVELSVESRPLQGLTIAAWAAYNDAQLQDAFPAGSTAFGAAGDRLPFSAPRSGNLSLDQEFRWQAILRALSADP